MDKPARVIVLGKDHEARGETYFGALEASNVAWGTSVGVTAKPNEDCLGVSVWGTEIVLAIADGHWGREASEIAVSKAVDLLQAESRPSQDSETRARLFALFEQVNTELYEIASSAPGASTSETTLIVCQVKEAPAGKYLYWASFGDSFLFLLRNGELKQLNTLNAFWLGYLSKLSENANANEARYAGVASGLETGIETLALGDVVFLCTDGLVGSDYKPEPSILAGIKEILNSGLPLAWRVEQILAAALNRGETDNISCVVTSIL